MTIEATIQVPCPYCKEPIIAGALKCRHCMSAIPEGAKPEPISPAVVDQVDTERDRRRPKGFRLLIACTVSALKKYFVFSGRASRSEFWLFMLGYLLIALATAALDSLLFPDSRLGLTNPVWNLFVTIPQISCGCRRLHDSGRSGAWLWILLTLIGVIPVIYWLTRPGDKGDNRFGPPPTL